jgi:hypothetical protein
MFLLPSLQPEAGAWWHGTIEATATVLTQLSTAGMQIFEMLFQ